MAAEAIYGVKDTVEQVSESPCSSEASLSRSMWHEHVAELDALASVLVREEDESFPLIAELERILGPAKKVRGVDARIIAFIEFAFFRAEGPYSAGFEYYTGVIARALALHPPMRQMLNRTAEAAIGNMVLNARGRLKFNIADRYELMRVLAAWERMGLRRVSSSAVLNNVLQKKVVQMALKRADAFLLARLQEIFHHQAKQFLPPGLDLDEVIYEHYRQRFASLIARHEEQGHTVADMIEEENRRTMPPGVGRNNFLAFLVKKKWNFDCQVCRAVGERPLGLVAAHHLIPISQGGDDHSANMVVVCRRHHDMAHDGRLGIESGNRLKLNYRGRTYSLSSN